MTRSFRLPARLRRFRRDPTGSLVVESVFIVPTLALALIAFFAFWDAYRSQNMVQKASYAIADMLSREMIPATPAFLDGLDRTLDFLVQRNARMRITSVSRLSDGPTGLTGLSVLWSYSPGNAMQPLTAATLQRVERDIPMMAIGSNVVIVEVSVPFTSVGQFLSVTSMDEVVVVRPRFVPRLCLTTASC